MPASTPKSSRSARSPSRGRKTTATKRGRTSSIPAPRARSTSRSRGRASTTTTVTKPKPKRNRGASNNGVSTFEWFLWILLCVENWILDFGRPIAMLYVPVEWSPLNKPSLGDYFHMLYNVITPFCLLALLDKSPGKGGNARVTYIMIITFVMGASIHLVGDSVNQRLIHVDYKNHIPLQENEIMKKVAPLNLLWTFELLYYYDEYLGHTMWYIPYFVVFFLYMSGCYVPKDSPDSVTRVPSLAKFVLVPASALYYWYLVTEGQIFPLFAMTSAAMIALHFYKQKEGCTLDCNGRFLGYCFACTLLLVAVWVGWLWSDPTLRARYPGLIYVPEPWSYYTLYWYEYKDAAAEVASTVVANATRA